MNNASQNETTAETKTLSISDENISQQDYERLRSGEKVEVETKSEPVEETTSETEVDESDTSKTDEFEDDWRENELKENEQKKPAARGFKKRIDKLNARISEKEAEIEHWRREALRGQKIDSKPEEIKTTQAATQGEPNPEDYETPTEFYRAHAKWAATEEIKAVKESERQEKLKSEAESKRTEFHGKVDEFRKTHDDFDEAIESVDDIIMSPAVSQILLEADNGPELLYALAKDKEEYARICALDPFQAARALGRFESRLQKPSEETKTQIKQKTTKAPPPPKPISSSSANGKKSIYDENISQAEYERMRNEQEKRRAY